MIDLIIDLKAQMENINLNPAKLFIPKPLLENLKQELPAFYHLERPKGKLKILGLEIFETQTEFRME